MGFRTATVLASVILAAAGCQSGAETPVRDAVRVTNTWLGSELVQEYGRAFPSRTFKLFGSPGIGSVSVAKAINHGEADLGTVTADVAYTAFVGRLEGESEPFTSLRGIAVLPPNLLHLVLRPNSDVRSLAELRGHRVGTSPGTATQMIAEMILAAHGLKREAIQIESRPPGELMKKLMAGQLDAMFITGSVPMEFLFRAGRGGARILPIYGLTMNELRRLNPFLRPARIPRGSYPGQVDVVPTVAVDLLLVCRVGLDDDLVYELTKRFFQALPGLTESVRTLRLMDLNQAPATHIPLHRGAARYYRQRELFNE